MNEVWHKKCCHLTNELKGKNERKNGRPKNRTFNISTDLDYNEIIATFFPLFSQSLFVNHASGPEYLMM